MFATIINLKQEEHEPSSFPAILFEWFEGFRAWHVSDLSWIVGKIDVWTRPYSCNDYNNFWVQILRDFLGGE